MNAVELWSAACRWLRENMSEISYKTWVENTRPLKFTEHCLTLEAASDFIRHTLLTRYSTLLEMAVRSVLGYESEVVIRVKGEHTERETLENDLPVADTALQPADLIALSARYELFLVALADLLIGKGVLRTKDRSEWLRIQLESFLRLPPSDAIVTACLPPEFIRVN